MALPVLRDRACGQRIDAAVLFHPAVRARAAERLLDHADVFRVAAQRHITAFHAVLGEQRAHRAVGEQDVALRGKQHQPLVHAGGNVVKLRLTAFEFVQLGGDLVVLLIHAVQQGRKLVVRIVFERRVQVERHNRLQKHMGQPAGQQRRHKKRKQHDQHNPRRSRGQGAQRAVRRGRNAQHRAVPQPQRIVIGLLGQRGGQAAGFADPVFQRRGNLRPRGMVFHPAYVALIVVQHRAVFPDQRDAVGIHAADAHEFLPVIVLDDRGNIVALVRQTAAHILRQAGMHRNQQQRGGQQQGDQRRQENTAEYALPHPWSPMR